MRMGSAMHVLWVFGKVVSMKKGSRQELGALYMLQVLSLSPLAHRTPWMLSPIVAGIVFMASGLVDRGIGGRGGHGQLVGILCPSRSIL